MPMPMPTYNPDDYDDDHDDHDGDHEDHDDHDAFEGNGHTSKLEINLKPMPADNPQNGDDVAMLLTRCFFFSKQNYVFC